MSVLSVLPGTLLLVARMIDAASGVTQVVKLRLNPGVEQERLLAGYCGTARRVWNRLLGRIEAVTAQRKAEASYGIPASDLTPAVGWTKASLDKLVREHKDEWAPWHAEVPAVVLERTAHHLAAALGNWKAARARWAGPETAARPLRWPGADLVQRQGPRLLGVRRRPPAAPSCHESVRREAAC